MQTGMKFFTAAASTDMMLKGSLEALWLRVHCNYFVGYFDIFGCLWNV